MQKPDMVGLGEFLKPLNEKLMKAISLTEGRRSDFFNHQKAVAESLTALAWIAYMGKDCGEKFSSCFVFWKNPYCILHFASGYLLSMLFSQE